MCVFHMYDFTQHHVYVACIIVDFLVKRERVVEKQLDIFNKTC